MSLPVGSFDTSNITEAGRLPFSNFNNDGKITRNTIGGISIKNPDASPVDFHYREESSSQSETISAGDSFQYYAMDGRVGPDAIQLTAVTTGAGQTVTVNKYFANAFSVDWGDGATGNVTAATGHTYTISGTYTITLTKAGDRWTFQNATTPLIPRV